MSLEDTRPIAVSYLRMSTDAQLRGDSLRRQSEASRKYAEEHGLRLVENLEDIGVSAYRGKNASQGALGGFLASVRNGDIPSGSYLLVESLDRLSRQKILPSFQLFLEILSAGITIVTLLDNQVYEPDSSDFSQLIVTITLMSRAYEESNTKSKRLSSAWGQKRKNASKIKLTRLCPAWMILSEDRTYFILNKVRVKIVQRIFDLAVSGNGSYSIARTLNQQNIPPFGRSKYWIQSYVTKVLTERAVLGEFQPHRKIEGKRNPYGDPLSGYYPRIISDEVYFRAQAARQKRKVSGKGRQGLGTPNLFKNIAVCGYCGSPMHYVNKGKSPKGGTYLKCSGSISGSGCHKEAWRYDDFEASFLFFCSEVDLKSVGKETERRQNTIEIDEKIFSMKQIIAAKESERDRVYEMIKIPTVSSEYLGKKLEELAISILNSVQKLSELEAKRNQHINTVSDSPDDLEALIREFRNTGSEQNSKLRASLHQRLLSSVEFLKIFSNGQPVTNEKIWDTMDSSFSLERMDKYRTDLMKLNTPSNRLFTVGLFGPLQKVVYVGDGDPLSSIMITEAINGELRVSLNDTRRE